MSLSSTDPKVLFQLAGCFSCPEPKRNIVLQTYLLAQLAGFSTTNAGVQSLISLAACFDCLTIYQMIRLKAYLYATILGLPATIAGVEALIASSACYKCLTPAQRRQLETYLLAVAAGDSTTQAGVDLIVAAAKCFGCLDTKQLWQVQVYLLQQMAPGLDTSTVSDLMQGAACFEACLPPEVATVVVTGLSASVASAALPPCVTPSAPISVRVAPSPVGNPAVTNSSIRIQWAQPKNLGSLITSYTVKWGTVSGVYTNSATVGITPKLYTITGLTNGTQYFFVVQANSSAAVGCSSINSSEANSTTTGGGPASLITGLTSYWKLDEATNANRADSIGANTLTGAGIAATAFGVINGGAQFTLAGAGLQLASNSSVQFGAGVSKSFSCWFLTTTLGFTQVILSKWDDSGGIDTNGEYILWTNAGQIFFRVRNLANNADVTVTSAVTVVANNYYHIACGYDDTTQLVWIQADGETRVTAPCVGVRSASVQFRLGSSVNFNNVSTQGLDGFVDEVGMWSRNLTTSEVARLSASYSLPGIQALISAGTDNANRWNTQVQTNGGAAVAAATVSAVATFVDSLITAGLYDLCVVFNPFAPDNLTAALTPWSRVGSRTTWVNHNFVLGDLSVNGLAGNGTTKYIDLGFAPTSVGFATLNNTAIATYDFVIGNNGNTEIGLQDAGGVNTFSLYPNIGGTAFLDLYNNTVGQGRLSVAAPAKNGFYLGSRTAANSSTLYFANSTNAFASVASIATSGGALSAQNAYCFAINNNGAPLICNETRSFLGFFFGLTSPQGQDLFNAVQGLRVALLGGFR